MKKIEKKPIKTKTQFKAPPEKKNGRPKKKSNRGRPRILKQTLIQKLEYAFSIGCTDLEACLHAGISKSTLYNFQQSNPDFVERKLLLKENPFLQARETIFKNLKLFQGAAWFMERKKKEEFSQRTELTGADGSPIQTILKDIRGESESLSDQIKNARANESTGDSGNQVTFEGQDLETQ